jgi:hypothetical protein
MKITSFNPKIITQNAEDAVRLFEALGFEKRHEINVVDDQKIKNYRMKDANGNHVDISGVENLPRDIMTIRINVDNFDEAYEMLTARNLKPVREIVETESNKTVMMAAPSGFLIDLCHHKKR